MLAKCQRLDACLESLLPHQKRYSFSCHANMGRAISGCRPKLHSRTESWVSKVWTKSRDNCAIGVAKVYTYKNLVAQVRTCSRQSLESRESLVLQSKKCAHKVAKVWKIAHPDICVNVSRLMTMCTSLAMLYLDYRDYFLVCSGIHDLVLVCSDWLSRSMPDYAIWIRIFVFFCFFFVFTCFFLRRILQTGRNSGK